MLNINSIVKSLKKLAHAPSQQRDFGVFVKNSIALKGRPHMTSASMANEENGSIPILDAA